MKECDNSKIHISIIQLGRQLKFVGTAPLYRHIDL
jgi:hypothetical protein